jgi:nitrogen-specific signal transduction histidine kinase
MLALNLNLSQFLSLPTGYEIIDGYTNDGLAQYEASNYTTVLNYTDNEVEPDFSNTTTAMDTLELFLSDIVHPVLIVDQKDRIIRYHNRSSHFFGTSVLKGHRFEERFHVFGEEVTQEPIMHIPNGWFTVHESDFSWDGQLLTKIECRPSKQSPNQEVLKGWKNMISVMLHRFRSPMTGVKGFLNMLEEENTDPALDRRLLSINSGIDRMFSIMDEMERIYQIDQQALASKEATQVDILFEEVLSKYSKDQREQIIIHGLDKGKAFHGAKVNILPALEALLDNALEHQTDPDATVHVHLYSNRFIQVINKGPEIPERIKAEMFSPFVTSKADHIGIGLTLATLHAQQFGGTILHKTDPSSSNIYFTICFP